MNEVKYQFQNNVGKYHLYLVRIVGLANYSTKLEFNIQVKSTKTKLYAFIFRHHRTKKKKYDYV